MPLKHTVIACGNQRGTLPHKCDARSETVVLCEQARFATLRVDLVHAAIKTCRVECFAIVAGVQAENCGRQFELFDQFGFDRWSLDLSWFFVLRHGASG